MLKNFNIVSENINKNFNNFSELNKMISQADGITFHHAEIIVEYGKKHNGKFFVYYLKEKMIGCCYIQETKNFLMCSKFIIKNEYQSKGIGSFLFKKILNQAQKPIVITVPRLRPSAFNYINRVKRIRFYDRLGLTLTDKIVKQGKWIGWVMTSSIKINFDDFIKQEKQLWKDWDLLEKKYTRK